ncbi:MAG: nickel pincer cofactor biosynthesis protein LarC [Methanobacteriota archaeon]|nr:MAG: nickel pincer cofactor biosynthesis protein LarC [Euryarchaeota archaeon]
MLYIDAANAGISGDMFIAALLDLGGNPEKVKEALSPIKDVLGRYEVKIERVRRGPFNATSYRFDFEDRKITYSDAKEAVEQAGLSDRARDIAISCFETLAEAESKVHGVKKEELELDDVPDTISDFAVAAALLDDLGIIGTRVVSSPVNTGRGFFTFHGQRSTLPAPATAEILRGRPIFGDHDFELTTPTGASILVNLAGEFTEGFPPMTIDRIGYGAGYHDLDFPNVLKLYTGEAAGSLPMEGVAVLETNVDTATGETLGYLFERLIGEGALDVTVIPCIMKKNRPGQIIKVICRKEDAHRLTEIIMAETGTLGVRITPEMHRHRLKREEVEKEVTVNGQRFTVRFKRAVDARGTVISERPEFEDVKRIASETGLGLEEVKRRMG